jgi:hypothetical protein
MGETTALVRYALDDQCVDIEAEPERKSRVAKLVRYV